MKTEVEELDISDHIIYDDEKNTIYLLPTYLRWKVLLSYEIWLFTKKNSVINDGTLNNSAILLTQGANYEKSLRFLITLKYRIIK